MSSKTINNPAGVWGASADSMAQEVVYAVNNSGGTLLPGDVVVLTDVGGSLVTTTTTADHKGVVGVVAPSDGGTRTVASTETIASGAVMPVVVRGPARVNIGGNTVAALAAIATSTAAKVAAAPGTPVAGGILGVALEAQTAKDANNTIRALIKLA